MKIKDLPFFTKMRSIAAQASIETTGTKTITEKRGEPTDADPLRTSGMDIVSVGTRTFTKVKGEDTDKDPYDCLDFNHN